MEDEPFDSMGGNGPPSSSPVKKSTPNVPPSFAFDHGGNMPPAAPPPSSFQQAPVSTELGTTNDELGAIPVVPKTSNSGNIMSTELPDRWKQYEEASPRGSPSSSRPKMERQEAPDLSRKPAELAPRQPYSFKKSQSYDTNELIRKYGGMAGMPPAMGNPPAPAAPISVRPADVRDQAMKVMDLVDDKLSTPFDVRRTQSGGFRMEPDANYARSTSDGVSQEPEPEASDPYSFRRSASSSSNGGRRVPSALAGLDFNGKPAKPNSSINSGRYSFSDPNFRDDDHISDEEDEILRQSEPFHDEPVVDVANLESRSAASRPVAEKKFDGDFPQASKNWSARYSDTYVTQQKVLQQWDREFEQERQGAQSMFMSTANSIRSSANNMLASAGNQKDKIFGSGGFSFRNSHVFGHQQPAVEKPEVNLHTVWKEGGDDSIFQNPPRVHKTWQEVMLNKKKRRRLCAVLLFLIFAIVVGSWTSSALLNREVQFAGSSLGETVTMYVTSDAPYGQAAEERLVKDLQNIPHDAHFAFHLGNFQEVATSMCPSNRYTGIASILEKSPVPLFVVPGSEDWVKCPTPGKALESWLDTFEDFDLRFKHGINVKRDGDNPEAIAMLHRGVLFMGLHIVSGPVVDEDLWTATQHEMLKFYYGMANLNKGSYRAIVLLGNARPSPQQEDFFNAIFDGLKPHSAPIVYVHANNPGDDVMYHFPFEKHPNVPAIGIQNGSRNPPLKITVGFGAEPFLVG